MAVRIRENGRIFCAAMSSPESGDTYIGDDLHYTLSVRHKVLVTQRFEEHRQSGEWWWKGSVPQGVEIDEFYKN